MLDHNSNIRHDKEQIQYDVIKIIEDIDSEWENQLGRSLGSETLLGADLGFKSIDIVRFIAAIQKFYDCFDLPFQDLFILNDRPINDLRVSDFVDFLNTHLNQRLSP